MVGPGSRLMEALTGRDRPMEQPLLKMEARASRVDPDTPRTEDRRSRTTVGPIEMLDRHSRMDQDLAGMEASPAVGQEMDSQMAAYLTFHLAHLALQAPGKKGTRPFPSGTGHGFWISWARWSIRPT